MFTYLPVIVGSIFCAVGLNFIFHYLRLKKVAKRVQGRIIAIERYTSKSRHAGETMHSHTTYFRPIAEYQYNGETRKAVGVSVNEIRHKLNQRVTILLHTSKDGEKVQASIEDSLNILFGAIFALFGFGALGVFIALEGNWIIPLIAAGTVTGIGHVISSMILNFSNLIKNTDNDYTPREDSTLIETKANYIKEVSSHGFWGGVIAGIFMLGSIGIMYAGYTDLPTSTQKMIWQDPTTFWNHLKNGTFTSSTEKPLMIFGIGLFFFLASLRSVYYVRKKYGALLRL